MFLSRIARRPSRSLVTLSQGLSRKYAVVGGDPIIVGRRDEMPKDRPPTKPHYETSSTIAFVHQPSEGPKAGKKIILSTNHGFKECGPDFNTAAFVYDGRFARRKDEQEFSAVFNNRRECYVSKRNHDLDLCMLERRGTEHEEEPFAVDTVRGIGKIVVDPNEYPEEGISCEDWRYECSLYGSQSRLLSIMLAGQIDYEEVKEKYEEIMHREILDRPPFISHVTREFGNLAFGTRRGDSGASLNARIDNRFLMMGLHHGVVSLGSESSLVSLVKPVVEYCLSRNLADQVLAMINQPLSIGFATRFDDVHEFMGYSTPAKAHSTGYFLFDHLLKDPKFTPISMQRESGKIRCYFSDEVDRFPDHFEVREDIPISNATYLVDLDADETQARALSYLRNLRVDMRSQTGRLRLYYKDEIEKGVADGTFDVIRPSSAEEEKRLFEKAAAPPPGDDPKR